MPQKKKPSLRIGQRYRANRVDTHYDTIIIGSGIGGMATAAMLTDHNQRVLMLEQHYTLGGMTHAYEREGFEWDVGVHYIGDVGVDTTLSKKVFDWLTSNNLKWASLGACYDRIHIGSNEYLLPPGQEEYRSFLHAKFPDDIDAIDHYIIKMKNNAAAARNYTASKLLPEAITKLGQLLGPLKLPDDFFRPTREVLEEITDNQELIAVWCAQWGDLGLPPAQSAFFMHCLIAKHYLHGAYYPVGGSSEFARQALPKLTANNSQALTYAKVAKIITEGQRAIGVEMLDGTQIFANNIVSNAGAMLTYQQLVPQSLAQEMGYLQNITSVKRSMSHVCLYIGLHHDGDELALPKHNYWLYPSADFESGVNAFTEQKTTTEPMVYISFPSQKDPTWNERYPGKSTIEIVAPGLFSTYAPWQEETWNQRGDEYEAMKEDVSQRLLEHLYQQLPQLRGKIAYYELSTPLSTRYFCEWEEGEIYGLDHTPARFKQTWLRPKSKIKGLYLTGQDVLSCGVAGAMIAGVACGAAILGPVKGAKKFSELMR